MKYNTINTIIDDIMLEMRRNNITESESYSRKQIEQWIIQYRMLILNELSNKKLPISRNYYQRFKISMIDSINNIGSISMPAKVSTIKIPEYFSNDIGLSFLSSYDILGNEIHVMSEKRSDSKRHSRYYNVNIPIASVKSDKKYYLTNADNISEIMIEGIFIDPTEIEDFDYDNDMYPLDPAILPNLKQLIFKGELKYNLIPDTKNDGKEEFQLGKFQQ